VTNATQLMDQARQEHQLSFLALCRHTQVPYSTSRRWRRRLRRQEPVLQPPGPKKKGDLDHQILYARLREQPVGPHRCPGAGALFAEYRWGISRRDFRELVHTARLDRRHEDLATMIRITWHYPGTVWAMDDLQVGHTAAGGRLWSTTVTDLASNYRIPEPLLGTPVNGEKLAGHLDRLFARYGAPVVLKQDNAGNLNHPLVAAVCAAYGVLRLTNPVHYPRFNGGIERSQGELRAALAALGYPDRALPPELAAAALAVALYHLNHKPRRQLQNKTACQVFTDPANRITINRRTRKELHDTIDQLTGLLLATIAQPTVWQRALAYRQAVEAVLQDRGFFSSAIARKVLPSFLAQNCS
jgi:hypothetical protein